MPSILQGRGRESKPAPQSAAADEHMQTPMPEGGGGESRSTLISRGDGTHAIEHEDGNTTEHPHIGHALMAMAAKHSDGMHHHTQSDGMGGGHTVHTSEHGGEPEGPQEHPNLESVKQGMDQFFNEEADEPAEDNEDEGGGKEKKSEGKDY